jgi:DnaK suppressor protein
MASSMEVLKQRLQNKERELLADIARFEEEARASGEAEVRDSGDDATAAEAASETLQEGTLASQTLTLVQDALRRFQAGTYGRCIRCGRPIEAARLEAIPWAQYCLEDQEKQDRAAHVPQHGSTL